MNAKPRWSFLLLPLLWLGFAPIAAAQPTAFRAELLSLLPDDFAVCVVMHDLHGHAARWEQSDWLKAFHASPLGKTVLEAPEMKQFEKWQSEMKRHFNLDWPALRDDILGDTVILAYSPGSKNKPDDEHGLFLLQVRKPGRLTHFIDKLNEAQLKSGELKSLAAVEYKGATYQRREEKNKTQFYFVEGSLAAVTGKEALMHAFLDKRPGMAKNNPWAKRFEKAGADQAFLTLCVNPRKIEPDFGPKFKREDAFPSYWRALDGIFVTLSIQDDTAIRITIQAKTDELPNWAKAAFSQTAPPSTLWQRFPETSIVTIASQLDFAGMVDGLKMLLPEKERKNLVEGLQRSVGAILELDPFADILPNIGPDWGVCVLPGKNAEQMPSLIVAVAVRPGSKKQAVDQALFRGVQTLAQMVVLEHNNKQRDTMRMQTVMQDKIEIKYLTSEKFFPPGVQPACALKDGFLLFATSPDAIADFRFREIKAGQRKGTPLLRLSTQELAKLLRNRREHILSRITEKDAQQHLENVIALLGLFERVTLSQHGEAGQASWTIRLSPVVQK